MAENQKILRFSKAVAENAWQSIVGFETNENRPKTTVFGHHY
jgi:hypothetical protein